LSHILVLSALGIFEIGSYSMSRPTWTAVFLFDLPHVAEMTDMCHYAHPLVEMGS
jgi:hypothetical protein